MSVLTLSPVSAGVYTALNVSAITSIASGPYDTEAPQGATFPYVWFVVTEENARGFGRGQLAQIALRVHAASTSSSTKGAAKEVQTILSAAKNLLEDHTLTISGFTQQGEIVYVDTTEPFPSEIGGKACWEAVANFTLWVQP